nr:NADH dehydrogenase subunit 4 [Oecleopsis sp.]
MFFLTPFCFLSLTMTYLYGLMILIFFFFLININDFYGLISFGFGLDKISFGFCILSLWICVLMIYSMMFYSFTLNFWVFLFNLNLMIFFLILCFSSLDMFSFYFFFESSILPVFLIILGWGYQPERINSGMYLIFYTLFSSLPLLLCVLYISSVYGYFYFLDFFSLNSFFISFFFLFAFLVKFPMFLFHFWLPKAHVEAPVSGSMILAGVMLSLGGYGFIRLSLFLDYFFYFYSYIIISLSLFGSFFIGLICLIQMDLKILIAYSSVSHMGLVISGLFTLSDCGFLGGYFLMIGHGLISSGLFYWVGCIYNRFGTRSLLIIKGLMNYMPSFSFFLFLLCACNMSCPPSLNLFSEICIVFSLFSWSLLSMLYIFFILFLTACYSILIFSLSQHGYSSSLSFFMDGGFLIEYYVFFLHLFPFFIFIFGLDFFF